MKIISILTIVSLLGVLAAATLIMTPTADARDPQGGGTESCSITCTLGGGCSAFGPAPCNCECSGFLGLGGPRCSCGGGMMDNPAGG